MIEKIVEKSKMLDSFPRMGRIVPEIGDEDIREIIIYSYRLIYEISANGIEILTVVHGKQNFPMEKVDNYKKE
ncbi:MAG: type II toxin-antitoxin system RelE/ParE family toxin [Candidatus Desulfofervidaceae bacterium]|nr:type II toxin-antitoxin system RelE/ParE family toxin [Candidatus Desulfofervidaceae bacterium]